MKEKINILYAGNSKVFDGMLLSLLSIIEHTNNILNVYCFTMNLQELNPKYTPLTTKHEKYLDNLLKTKNNQNFFKLFDITNLFKKHLINSVNINQPATPYSMLRLFPHLVEEIPNKFIYLDTDTLINKDLEELFDIDISNYELGVVLEDIIMIDLGRLKQKHFNAGVLLVNLDKAKQNSMFDKAIDYCLNKKTILMDQDALNYCCTEKLYLPEKFNAKRYFDEEFVINHFSNIRKKDDFSIKIKPWNITEVKELTNIYDNIFDKFLTLKNQKNYPEK